MAGTTAGDQEDMAIISPADSGDTTRVEGLPTVDLSFAHGAWDDRELVRAYDTAMEEFHMHHPGPGSWLDKTTALLAKGQPLPGVKAKDSAWYASSWEGSAMDLANPEGAQKRRKLDTGDSATPKGVQAQGEVETVINPYDLPVTQPNGAGPIDPYGGSGPNRNRRKRGSPVYAPPSPPSAPRTLPAEQEVHWEEPTWEEHSFGDGRVVQAGPSRRPARTVTRRQEPTAAPVTSATSHEHGPILGVQATGGTSREEAIGYAMTAQYWAGYWMGVAQSRSEGTVVPPVVEEPVQPVANGRAESDSSSDSSSSEESSSEEESEEEAPVNGKIPARTANNVVITRKQFPRPTVGQALKR